jgi:hypothetical protein
MNINEDHPIYRAIDRGGGQCCDVPGIITQLRAAGYVIVPVEPTEEMLNAEMNLGGYGYGDDCYQADPKDIWRAMIGEVAQ